MVAKTDALPPVLPASEPEGAVEALLAMMRRLRAPVGGCPWDLEQTFETIAPYTIEEAHEVVDAIVRKDMDGLKDELGDLLLQVVFHSQMASEASLFDFSDVARHVTAKMISRHPHVFGADSASSAEDVVQIWEARKAQEKAARRGSASEPESAIGDAAPHLPALKNSEKLQHRADKVGFGLSVREDIYRKLDEELDELKEAIASGDQESQVDELGDVLFVLVNLARVIRADPELALRRANLKFEKRFKEMERIVRGDGLEIPSLTRDQWIAYYQKAKARTASY